MKQAWSRHNAPGRQKIPVSGSQGQLPKKAPSHVADICGVSAAPAIKGGSNSSQSGPRGQPRPSIRLVVNDATDPCFAKREGT